MSKKEKILLPEGDEQQKKAAIELAGFLGYHSENLEFPVLTKEDGPNVLNLPKQLDSLSNYILRSDSPNTIRNKDIKEPTILKKETIDNRKNKGLETIFEIGNFLKDQDGDFLPDHLDLKISLKEKPTEKETIAAANFAARFAMDTLGYNYPIIWDQKQQTNLLIIEENSEETSLTLEQNNILLKGKDIDKLSTILCNNLPYISKTKTLMDLIKDIDSAISMTNLDGQKAYLKVANKPEKAYLSPDEKGYNDIKELFPTTQIKGYKDLKQIEKRQYDITWEVDSFKEILQNKIKPIAKGNIEISYSLSEDQETRQNLNNYIKKVLGEVKINSVCTYKQGFSWIDEQIIPKLKEKTIDKIKIGFRAFLPQGQSDWNDENGTTPTITSQREDQKNKWFDLPIRLLQELYPIDDVISQKLGLPTDNIEFYLLEDKEIDYKIQAYNNEKEILTKTYKGAYSKRPYLSQYEGIGKVHPATGYVKVKIDEKLVFEEQIPTDLERIWSIYQDDILPFCKTHIMDKTKSNPKANMQPFFSQMRLDIEVSEPDYRLGIREDMISSLDALHEDIYFVGLDFFKTLGLKTTGENLDAPGLILPVIKKTKGKPKMTFTLYGQEKDQPCIITNEKTITPKESKTYIKSINLDGENLGIHIEATKDIQEIFESLQYLNQKNKLNLTKNIDKINFVSYKGIKLTTYKTKQQKSLTIEEIDIMEDQLIGYEEYIKIIKDMSRVEKLRVMPIAKSYQGRTIYSIELMPKTKGYTSRVKSIDNRPTKLIIGRHHANEVSGTNANFMLIKNLLTDKNHQNIDKELNLVFIPMENPDGAAIHYELAKDNPNWKLHIARFNSLGKEMAGEYFKDNTIHTECLAFTNVWRKWLPDIITDNHGVPSHEWDQQFSGYTSPWFKGFWMPRALLYSYFFHIQDDNYKDNLKVNKAIEDVVAQSMKEDKEIRAWNLKWQERFQKYAHSWMPKLFPANYYKELISYWVASPYKEDHNYAAVRYPWITAASFVSEVSDETAQGEYLYLCARTHMLHDIAVINMLKQSKIIRQNSSTKEKLIDKRLRPIICPQNR